MKIHRRTEYGLQLLVLLAGREKRWSARSLAEESSLPFPFVQQILLQLREGGLIASIKGRRGGYALALPPTEVSLGEVVRLLEDSMDHGKVSEESALAAHDEERGLAIRDELRRLSLRFADRYSLADLMEGRLHDLPPAHRDARHLDGSGI